MGIKLLAFSMDIKHPDGWTLVKKKIQTQANVLCYHVISIPPEQAKIEINT